MINRKVQQVGHSTLSISLPSEWAKSIGLKKGDVVVCKDGKNGSLNIIPISLLDNPSTDKTAEQTIDGNAFPESKMLERLIIGNYVVGSDVIKIRLSPKIRKEMSDEIRRTAGKLMGLSVVEDADDLVTLQCSLDLGKFPVHKLLQRLFKITSSMVRESFEAFMTLDTELAGNVVQMEDDVDRTYWFIARLLFTAQQNPDIASRIGIENGLDVIDERLVSKYLETIADSAAHLAESVLSGGISKGISDRSICESLARISELAGDLCEDAEKAVFSRDFAAANRAIEMLYDVQVECENVMRMALEKKHSCDEISNLYRVVRCLRSIAEHGSGIAEVALNRIGENEQAQLVEPSL
jgi:phosphate uptake regulator